MNIELTRVVVGVFILLLIALLPVRRDSGSRRAFLGFVGGIFIVLGVAALIFRLGDFELDNRDEGVIKAQIINMQRDQQSGVPKNLIIIEGSSQTALGMDGETVEEDLRQAGYQATVVTLAGLGGNHLERYKMLSRWRAEVRRYGLALSPNTRLLLEVAPGYDSDPIRYILKNKDSLRAYYYADLHNIVYAVQSLRIVGPDPKSDPAEEFSALVSDALTSTFRVGQLPYMRRFDAVAPVNAFEPSRAGIHRMSPYNPHRFFTPHPPPLLAQWTDFEAFRTREMAGAVGDDLTEVDYFSVPVMPAEKRALYYAHAFCAQRRPAPCIDSTDPAIYGALDAPKYHFNRDHLSRAGAEVYSHYLAQQLIAQGVVVK